MKTPISDFVQGYAQSQSVRLHMPGHKGQRLVGPEALDITEIDGADVLYRGQGIIAESQEHASRLFGSGKTLYSTEGSSLSIRAMVYLVSLWARMQGHSAKILAGRNAHKTFMSACALCDMEVSWLYGAAEETLLSCTITAEELRCAIDREKPTAVYLTSPDYLGQMANVAVLSRICHEKGVLLLVDNAHGAYLHFLPEPCHPLDLGADLVCDSAHKTLPVLTGGAYLHLSPHAPQALAPLMEQAMMLFASTSPSYLILQSLDACNAVLAGDFPQRLKDSTQTVRELKKELHDHGYSLIGEEALKITLAPKAFGYTGEEISDILWQHGIVSEFSDRDFWVGMISPENTPDDLRRLRDALLSLPRRQSIQEKAAAVPRLTPVLSIREALFAPTEIIPAAQSAGHILADHSIGCPPAIPIAICGERLDESAVCAFAYYGVEMVRVVKEDQ